MPEENTNIDKIPKANATPSKNFFVNMLVRDIELKDALLDLLDNCVDGILRNYDPDLSTDQPYQGYWANFIIGPDGFELEDNCGGIPLEIATKRAFAVGKPTQISGEDGKATVGMYGIGMKRAIWKMGLHTVVESWSDQPFRVTIGQDWLKSDSWHALPMELLEDGILKHRGTKIKVTDLKEDVKQAFGVDAFIDELYITISQNYSLIINKGFEVTIRRKQSDVIPAPITEKTFDLLWSNPTGGASSLAPYIYKGTLNEVEIEIYAGLYRKLPDSEETETDNETTGTTDDAGWTIACNDRVVVWKDRTRLTGWGEATVPNYHTQFIAITGIVLLRSADPHKLPLTTTKRGVDASTEVFSFVKDMMREATKALTTFTNKWKKFPKDLEQIYQGATSVALHDIQSSAASLPMKSWAKTDTIMRFVPNLPAPKTTATSARVSFVAEKQDVIKLGLVYFDDAKAAAKDVGYEAFRRELQHYSEAAE